MVRCTLFIKIIYESRFANILNEPLTYLFRSILDATLDLNLGSTYISIKRSIYSLAHQSALLLEAKVLEEHSYREHLRQGVSNVKSLSLWP